MVQHGVEGLMFLMTESSKHMVTHSHSDTSLCVWNIWGCLLLDPEQNQSNLHYLAITVNRSHCHTLCVCVQISEVDFLDSVLVLGFGEELNQILLQVPLNRCFHWSQLILAVHALNQSGHQTVHCTLAKCVRVFVAAVPAAPQSDPQHPESAALQPACLPQPGMETGCTSMCV